MSAADRFGRSPGLVSTRVRGVIGPWLLCCFAVCVAIGVIAGVNPTYGIIAALGLMFAVVTIMDVTLGFILFTVASFMDMLSASGSFSGTKVIGLVLFVAWLARIATRRGVDLGELMGQNPGLVYSLLAMLGWSAISFTWATDRGAALGGTGRYALVMMLIPIAFTAIRRREHATSVVAAFVIGAVLSAAYGFIHPTAATSSDAGRFTGANGDANAEATVLAAAIPLLLGLWPTIRHPAMRVASLAGLALLFVGLVETLSREGLVALGAILVGAVVFGGRWRRHAALLLVAGALLTVGYYVVVAPQSAVQRVTMSDTSGRTSLWTIAWRVIQAHPVLGVGNDNFMSVEAQYINRPGLIVAYYVVQHPKLTHNTYLEAAADLGIPGLLTLLLVLYFAVRAGVRAAWTFEELGDEQMELLSRAVVLALVGILTASFFVAGNYEKFLWIPIALCPALQRLARRASDAHGLPAGSGL